jgi:hypothetical protein
MLRRLIVVSLFILIAFSTLFLGHYFFYYSAVYFFRIDNPAQRLALAALLYFLPLSFIAASILMHWTDNVMARAVYFLSALWLGVGLSLIAAFALAWAAWGVTGIFTHTPRPLWFGLAAVTMASLYSVYGVWNAYHPRIENLTVRIKNLSPAWRGRKVVQLTDVHLGPVLGAGFLARQVARVNAENPAAVFITGDLFDGADGKLEQLVAPLNDLRAPLGIYFVTGNHETYLGVERALAALRTTPIRVLADERVMIEGLQVIGLSYPERGQSLHLSERLARLPDFDPDLPSILLYHSPTHVGEARSAGISLQLAGHVHQGQLFPLQFITRLIYGKYYHGLHVEGDYTLYAASGVGTWGPTMRTGNHPEIPVIRLE